MYIRTLLAAAVAICAAVVTEDAEAAHRQDWGRMLAVRGTRIEAVPLSDVAEGIRTVPPEDVELSNVLWGH